jgi:hypothetical protein
MFASVIYVTGASIISFNVPTTCWYIIVMYALSVCCANTRMMRMKDTSSEEMYCCCLRSFFTRYMEISLTDVTEVGSQSLIRLL